MTINLEVHWGYRVLTHIHMVFPRLQMRSSTAPAATAPMESLEAPPRRSMKFNYKIHASPFINDDSTSTYKWI